jgi:hypothetical protein
MIVTQRKLTITLNTEVLRGALGLHGFSALDRPGETVLVAQKLVGAGPAVYEQAVVKSERADSRGLNPTVYSASLIWMRRHIF